MSYSGKKPPVLSAVPAPPGGLVEPARSWASWWQLLAMGLLGFSCALPLALTGSTLQAWMTVSGVDLVWIGFLSWCGQPYIYKFLWSPAVDRIQLFPGWGQKRGWMATMQLLCMILIGVMAAFEPAAHWGYLFVLAFVVAIFSATQDIAVDAARVLGLKPHERALGSAVYVTGYRLGLVIAGGGALIASEQVGWAWTYRILAACMGVGMLGTWIFRESGLTRADPTGSTASVSIGSWLFRLWEPIRLMWQAPYFYPCLVVVMTYKMADAFAFSLHTAFLIRELGYSATDVGLMSKTVGLGAAIVGGILGGWYLLRVSLWRGLWVLGLIQAATIPAFIVLLEVPDRGLGLLGIVVALEQVATGMGTAVFLAFLLTLCDKKHAATQYAFWSAIAAIGRVYIGPVAAWMVQSIGWHGFFLVSPLWILPAFGGLLYMQRRGLDQQLLQKS